MLISKQELVMKNSNKLITATLAMASTLCAPPLFAQTSSGYQQMQKRVNALQHQVASLKTQVSKERSSSADADNSGASQAKSSDPPKDSLRLGGGVVTEYQYKGYGHGKPGGDLKLDYFEVNAHGKIGKALTFGAEERFSTTNFANSEYLHYGWVAYHFGAQYAQQIKGGYFQVPFGNLPYGYQTFWGNLAYYAGFTDHQGAGLGYRYKNDGWRFDADFYKNDTLGQSSTYAGGVPTDGYENINTGNLRLAYTLNRGNPHRVTFSLAGKGGQLYTASRALGSQWAGTAAMNGHWGPWNLQLQAIDYAYNVPQGATNDAGTVLNRDSITAEDYGYSYQMPGRGQLYSANLARSFHVNWGPFHKVELYDNYGYLDVGGNGRFNSAAPGSTPNSTGNVQLNAAGAEFVAGPVYIWADVLTGRNSGMAFVGPNDGHWHTRFNLAAAFYFGGTIHSS